MILRIIAVLALLIPSVFAEKPAAHTQGTPTGRPTGPIRPGEYWWNGQASPQGPVVALVSIPLQTISVYRNGILIGRSSVSTGAPGHPTPGGVFTILEKKQKHFSKTYDNAPMPNMQRLTWSGIAMHSGNLPGYPASHGCIRMPWDFSRLLFSVTASGGTVVIGDGKKAQPHLANNPGLMLAPKDFTPEMLQPLANDGYDWHPQRSPSGPVTIMISGTDRTMYVYRNGNPIGRAAIQITGSEALGSHVFTMLEGVSEKKSFWAPGRAAKRWMCVNSNYGRRVDPDSIARRLRFNPEFATKLYDIVAPGTTVIVTDAPAVRKANRNFTVLTN